ncbi:hypothetical protein LJC37_00655 [Bacteroidales bacterium OttesenSCG-928-E04]|nr:hypothetical protein [Bacteroidales bacterium OttesenSCG-928-E04]
MASFLSLYNDIEYKLKKGALRIQDYSAKVALLEDENEGLKLKIADLERKVKEMEDKNSLLTITKTSLKKEDKTETKKRINDLVREIDNCIKLLNK